MKLLRIESNQGQFLDKGQEFLPIDKITKEDLLRFVELTLDEDAEFDEYDDNVIKNPAHQIIYKSIYQKLMALKDRKAEFKDESERLYLTEYEKYRENLSPQGEEGDGVMPPQ